jgi:flavodoxin
MLKKLVAYFSASENRITAEVAKNLAEVAGADLYEIKPEKPYTAADLDWQNANSRSSVEMKNKSFRPAIADKNLNVSEYDVVFVGFPIWWYVAPTIINTFLESADFSDKMIVPFATSGSSGIGNTVAELKTSAPKANYIDGKMLNGNPSKADLKAWVESLKL